MVIFNIWVTKVYRNSDSPLFRSTQIWTHLSTIQIKLDLILGGNLRLMKSKICLNVHYSDPVCNKGDWKKDTDHQEVILLPEHFLTLPLAVQTRRRYELVHGNHDIDDSSAKKLLTKLLSKLPTQNYNTVTCLYMLSLRSLLF